VKELDWKFKENQRIQPYLTLPYLYSAYYLPEDLLDPDRS